jgi:hypothetical protein
LTALADAGVALPTGWLWEDGGTYSRTAYANLFGIGTSTVPTPHRRGQAKLSSCPSAWVRWKNRSPSPMDRRANGAEELFALAFWEMTIVVEVMLTTVVEVGMPAPSTAFEALVDKAGERARDAA